MKLQPRSLVNRLKKRYKWSDEDAQEFAEFLLPMLDYDPRRRATAAQCLRHPWLQTRQRPASSAAMDPSSPPAVQQESVEPTVEGVMPEIENPAPDTVVTETKCDAASETDKDDNALPETSPTTVDASAWLRNAGPSLLITLHRMLNFVFTPVIYLSIILLKPFSPFRHTRQ